MEGRIIPRPASLGFRGCWARCKANSRYSTTAQGMKTQKISHRLFPTKYPQKKLSLTYECFLTGDWNDPNGTYGEP